MKRSHRVRSSAHGLVRLTRAREHLPFVVPISLMGSLLGASQSETQLDWRFLVVTLANVLAVTYAFMINDIEDSEDDSTAPESAARNAVSSGIVSPRLGWGASAVVFGVSLVLYGLVGGRSLILGAAILAISHFYSWRLIRLKSLFLLDVLSHALMLGGLLMLSSFYAYSTRPGWGWAVMLAITLFSAYGQLYNQIRDYRTDRAVGLRTTTVELGARRATWVMYGLLGLSGLFFMVAIAKGQFPLAMLVTFSAVFALSTWRSSGTRDARGSPAEDFSGSLQTSGLLATNSAVVLWLTWAAFDFQGALAIVSGLFQP